MKQSGFKLIGVFALGLLFRLLPFRAPNVELVLASQMPIAKAYGGLVGFCFGVFSIFAFDLLTGTLGPWSLITGASYGLLGILAGLYFKNRSTQRHFAYFAVFGTLLYDALTGLTIGPLFFNQPFLLALTGQIPFTLMHLLGNVSFALLVSPFLFRFFQTQPRAVMSPSPVLGLTTN